MIYKFLKPSNFFKGILASYKSTFSELFVPKTEDEKFCYVELSDQQLQDFIDHFGNGIEVLQNANEYPGSNESMKNNRIENFIRVAELNNYH